MDETSQINLSGFSRRMPVGWCANGAPYPLDLGKSHGVIVGGGTGAARKQTVQAMLAAFLLEEGTGAVWCGADRPEAEGVEFAAEEKALERLKDFCGEQIRRYEQMKAAGSNNLPHYNAFAAERKLAPMPFQLFILEDYQDCLARFGRPFTDQLCFAARYGRACGMLPVVCTSSAEPEKLPSLLKAEISDRICLGVPSRRESLSLLGALGGESLKKGDLLYRHVADKSEAVRLSAQPLKGENA